MSIQFKLKTTALAALLAASATIHAENFDAQQTKDIEKIVHDYIVKNPEVLIEASQVLQSKQQQAMQQEAEGKIEKNASQLFAGKVATAGNPNGDVTLVEFFDYQCIHCKKMAQVVSNLVKQNKNLRVIYKEFPIFGESSELASKAALAAGMQGKYDAMHHALLAQQKRLNEDIIMNTAKTIGLNMDKFKKDLNSQAVQDELKNNQNLGKELNLMGTPAFIIAKTPKGTYQSNSKPIFIPGAASFDALSDFIKKVEGNS